MVGIESIVNAIGSQRILLLRVKRMSGWWYLSIAILFEIMGTTCMKLADGLTRPLPAILLFVFYAIAFTAMAFALKNIEVGAAYAVWSGVGTAAIAVIGCLFFQESVNPLKIGCIGLILIGVVGLRLADPQPM